MALTLLKRFWPELVVAAIVALLLHFTYQSGYDARVAEEQAQTVAQVKKSVETLKTDTAASLASNEQVAAQVRKVDAQAGQLKDQLRAHFKPAPRPAAPAGQGDAPPTTQEPPHETIAERFGRAELDLGTVRLLNRAALRPVADPGAAQPVDAEVAALADTASGLTGADLAEHDVEVKAAYQALAARHDELVDYVLGLCRRHACVLPP